MPSSRIRSATRLVSGSAPSPRAISIASASDSSSSSSDSISARSYVQPTLAERVRRGPPVAPQHGRVRAPTPARRLDVDPGDGRPRGDADRAQRPRDRPLGRSVASELLEAARPASARRVVSAHSISQLEHRHDPLRLAGAVGLGRRARPAARAASGSPRRTASSASTVLASSWTTSCPVSISRRVIRSASSHSPRPQPQPGDDGARRTRRGVDLVRRGVGERPLRVAQRLARACAQDIRT